MNLEIEKQKSELMVRQYEGLIGSASWHNFVKDMEEQILIHKEAAIAYAQQGKMDDVKRQAWIVQGIEEAIGRPKYVMDYHKSFYEKAKQKVCELCGSIVQKMKF